MLKFLKKRQEKKDLKNFFVLIKEIRSVKQKLDDYFWIMNTYHGEHLPDQTADFMEKSEFALTSLMSCFGIAADSVRKKIIGEKVRGEKK